MSRQEAFAPADRLEQPGRRRALVAAGEALLAAAATPALPVLAQPAAAPALRVMHGFADHTTISLWIQGAAAQSLRSTP